MIATARSSPVFLLLGVAVLITGCSSVREPPTDAFAPRPESAKSASYQIVRLSEDRYSHNLTKEDLLKCIGRYRENYRVIKKETDFPDDYYSEHVKKQYFINVQSFKDSDLPAAERYLKSLPNTIEFTPADPDEYKHRLGEIDFTDKNRKLRIIDFYHRNYTSDWTIWTVVLGFIKTAREGYGKFTFSIKGEALEFRKTVQKRIWTFSAGYFEVHTQIYTIKNDPDHVPMLLVIHDPNDHGDMNGTYLIMPRNMADIEAMPIIEIPETKPAEKAQEVNPVKKAPLTKPAKKPPQTKPTEKAQETKSVAEAADNQLSSDPWDILTKDRFPEAKVIKGEMDVGKSPDKIVSGLIKYRGSDQSEDVLFKMIELYKQDPKRFEQRIDALSKE